MLTDSFIWLWDKSRLTSYFIMESRRTLNNFFCLFVVCFRQGLTTSSLGLQELIGDQAGLELCLLLLGLKECTFKDLELLLLYPPLKCLDSSVCHCYARLQAVLGIKSRVWFILGITTKRCSPAWFYSQVKLYLSSAIYKIFYNKGVFSSLFGIQC